MAKTGMSGAEDAAEKAYAEAAAANSPATAKPKKASKTAKAGKPTLDLKLNAPSAFKGAAPKAEAPHKSQNQDTMSGVDLFKDMIMAKNTKTEDMTATIQQAAGQAQDQFKAAYEKSSELTNEMVELSKGNVEAVVEAGKIFAAGVQEMGQTLVAESKEAMETATAEAKKIAAAQSPTEFFQVQNDFAKRGFDMFMANSSKNTEAFVKLANDTFAPLSTRASVAVEKISKVAA